MEVTAAHFPCVQSLVSLSHLRDQQSFCEDTHQPSALGARVSDPPLEGGPPLPPLPTVPWSGLSPLLHQLLVQLPELLQEAPVGQNTAVLSHLLDGIYQGHVLVDHQVGQDQGC